MRGFSFSLALLLLVLAGAREPTPAEGAADQATPDRAPGAAAAAPAAKPFRLPFRDPPGPDTWFYGQAYGNTAGAYRQRKTTYGAGQGVHFGIDFAAPCKTELVAIADGTVAYVDDLRFGSAPHNLIIQHGNGYASLYGHVYETPHLRAGQTVHAGDVVALSGDPDETCHSRPHLHLEIRDSSLAHAYNVFNLMEADWDSLALLTQFGRAFERDLDDPRKWQTFEDQPNITFGLPLLNDFPHAWPSSQGIER